MTKNKFNIRKSDPTSMADSRVRQRAYHSFCCHIANGFPAHAWFFREGKAHCNTATMIQYLNDDKVNEFNQSYIQEAHAGSYKLWFQRGIDLVVGTLPKHSSPVVWQVIMRHMFSKFGWDVKSPPADSQENHPILERLRSVTDEISAKLKEQLSKET